MRGITKVVLTDLFWETLGELRGTACYEQAVSNVKICIAYKMRDRGHMSNHDTPFSGQKELRGIWHCHIVKDPFKVLFYTVEDDTLNLCKVGDHSDYGWKGKNSKSAQRLALSVSNAIRRGNIPFSDWKPFRWTDPAAVAVHTDVAMMSRQSLDRLDQELLHEFESLALLSRRYGGDPARVPLDAAIKWLSEIEQARDALQEVMSTRHVLQRAFAAGRDIAFALSEPTVDEVAGLAMRLR